MIYKDDLLICKVGSTIINIILLAGSWSVDGRSSIRSLRASYFIGKYLKSAQLIGLKSSLKSLFL